jgi:N-acetyl-anhydromuramyl-L-alanine amidase AmpD
MSNSNLVNYVKLSPHCNKPRLHKIDKITIHHMAAVNASIERCGEEFAKPNRRGSSNYGVGSDGRIGMYVEEKNRAWTSSSPANDHRAVTIEVANDGGAPDWHVSDKALAATIDLCVDICRRNGIKALNFTGDATGNLTMHRYFTATSCPGPYLASKFPYIAQEVNRRLGTLHITPGKKKPTEEIAQEVIAGKWGIGLDRKKRLSAAGYDYAEVQALVNKLMKQPAKKTDYEIAREVIKGKWGTNPSRAAQLLAAGYNPKTIQQMVNKMLK